MGGGGLQTFLNDQMLATMGGGGGGGVNGTELSE